MARAHHVSLKSPRRCSGGFCRLAGFVPLLLERHRLTRRVIGAEGGLRTGSVEPR